MPPTRIFSLPDARERIDVALHAGTLARGARANGTDGLDVMSAMVPEAWEAGRGPGDGTWMAAFSDRGWPEWLVMLGVSLHMQHSGAEPAELDRLRSEVAVSGEVDAEDAAAFRFARELAAAVSEPLRPRRAQATFLAERLRRSLTDVQDAAWTGPRRALEAVMDYLEDRAAGADDLDIDDERALRRQLRRAVQAAHDVPADRSEPIARLCDLAMSFVRPGDEAVLLAFDLPAGPPGTRIATARSDLIAALIRARVQAPTTPEPRSSPG